MTASVASPPSEPRVHAMAETPSRRILHGVPDATTRFDALKSRLVKVANAHIQGYANQLLGSVRQALGSTLKPSVMRDQIQGADLYWRLFCANLDDLPAGLVDPVEYPAHRIPSGVLS